MRLAFTADLIYKIKKIFISEIQELYSEHERSFKSIRTTLFTTPLKNYVRLYT